METCRAHYDKISNEEFPWNNDFIKGVEAVSGPCEKLTYEEVHKAILKMKSNIASGPSGVRSSSRCDNGGRSFRHGVGDRFMQCSGKGR